MIENLKTTAKKNPLYKKLLVFPRKNKTLISIIQVIWGGRWQDGSAASTGKKLSRYTLTCRGVETLLSTCFLRVSENVTQNALGKETPFLFMQCNHCCILVSRLRLLARLAVIVFCKVHLHYSMIVRKPLFRFLELIVLVLNSLHETFKLLYVLFETSFKTVLRNFKCHKFGLLFSPLRPRVSIG